MLENLMLASKFDNLRTKFAEGSIERLEHISTPLILKWIKGVSKIIKNKLINTEVPDKLENIEVLEIDENKGQMLENLMLASKFDNSCPKFAEGDYRYI